MFLLNNMQDIECGGIKYIQSVNEMDQVCNNVFRCEENINFKIFVKGNEFCNYIKSVIFRNCKIFPMVCFFKITK